MAETLHRPPLIGEPAPAFHAETTEGRIRFPEDYKGRCLILFSHPGEEVIAPPPGSCGAAKGRVESQDPSIRCIDWLSCIRSWIDRRAGLDCR